MSGNWTAPTPKGSNSSSQQLAKAQGPPYASTMAIVGGVPSPAVDDPIAVVLLLLFLVSAGAHAAILKINKAGQFKFVFSGMLFALCLLRGVSLVARMIWASYPNVVNAVIAASVMTQCGSVLIFIINLFFAQRILRAYHPRLGWHRGAGYAVWFLIACVLCCLVMAIVSTIHSFFTVSQRERQADRAVQLFAGSYLAFLAFLPVPVVALAVVTHPRRFRVEKFGAGRWRAKVVLLIFTSLVATLGAGFRVGVNFDGRSGASPAWFHSRACYYCFNFVTDLVVSTAYLLARFDRRFIVPDGARGPGDYSPVSPVVPSSTTSKTNLTGSGKLPMMGSDKPLVMMRQGSLSGRTIVSPLKPFTPTTSSPQSRRMSRSATPSPQLSDSGNGNGNENTTDSSATAVRTSPTTSSSLNRGKQPSHHDYNPLAQHPHIDEPQERPQMRQRSAPKSTSTAGRMSRLGLGARRSVMRSVRMRINSEADAYGPDGSCLERGHAPGDIDPLVAHPVTPSITTATAPSSTPASRQRYRNPHSRRFLGRSRGGNISGSNGVRAPAPAYLGPPILPDLDLDLELLSTTLLAPWALDSWGFSLGQRISSRRSERNSRQNRSSHINHIDNDDETEGDCVYDIPGAANIADHTEYLMSGGNGEASDRSSSERNRSGENSCALSRQTERAKTM
ncbi:hypothetical protein GGR53DRAFT_467162 [Hypoxylon sp. FL1150]|nr:hypothetical protein GGR53DRAFT_467162 [Hypoxylon sp. FL1150]